MIFEADSGPVMSHRWAERSAEPEGEFSYVFFFAGTGTPATFTFTMFSEDLVVK